MKIVLGIISALVGLFAIGAIICLILALPTMWLWNYVVPYISNGAIHTLDFWHALALNFLCSILFHSSNNSSSKKDKK